MPTYEYECDKCSHRLEKFQSIKARPLKKCPECGENRLQRLIGTGGGVIFKGNGFYQTDYRSESYKKSAAAEKSSSSDSGSEKSKDAKSSDTTSTASSQSKPAKAQSSAGESKNSAAS